MISLTFRLKILFLVTIAITSVFALQTYNAHLGWTNVSQQIKSQHNALAVALKARHESYTAMTFQLLQVTKNSLPQSVEQNAMSDFIQAYASQDSKLSEKRFQFLWKLIDSKTRTLEAQLGPINYNLKMWALATFATPLVAFLILISFIRVGVLAPINRLAKHMRDFINNSYSVSFSTPVDNEIGNLHRQFNSLAHQVIQNVDDLKSLDRAKSEFLSIASHELRTPLTSIKGSLSLLSSESFGALDIKVLRLLRIAESETDRLIRLINELLDLAKIEARKLPLDMKWYNLNLITFETIESLKPLALKAKVDLSVHIDHVFEAEVDRDRYKQILTNLISNSIKFSPVGSTINIAIQEKQHSRKEQCLMVSVRDHGAGIPEEDQAYIFEKFRQGANSNSPVMRGTGLGLAIAKALVEQMGGYIDLESKVDQGSIFYFSIMSFRRAVLPSRQDSEDDAA